MFDQLETTDKGTKIDLKDVLSSLNFNKDGLIPAIAQDVESKQVLMLAWMDLTAIQTTLKEGNVCYWSRSRNTYWRKGETSNHFQRLVEMRIDCDGDTLLLLVEQDGLACHTNRRSCFYLTVTGQKLIVTESPQIA